MATLQEGQTNHHCCKCDIDSLLKRAINLIDPPLYPNEVDGSSTMMTGGNVNGDGSSELKSAILSAEQITSVPSSDLSTKPTTSTKTKKRVHFEESSFNKRNKLSAHDVIHAFKLLIHATSVQSSELSNEGYYMKSTWKELQEYADVYRALLITSCLLMEILPIESSGGEPMSDSSFNVKWESCNTICTPSPSNPPYTPFLSPTTIEQLLSTSRKCILQLQYLEKICAAKTIAERHTESLSFYSGGDDIEDYDRCTNDLHTNYDWHDDGFLPKPCSYNNGEDVCNNGVSILHECCYAPHNLSVQPSSRYEKNAATKEWIRGERLISMCVEDYYECFDDVSTYNREVTADMTNGKLQKQCNDIFNVEEDMPFFTLAPAELAQEEESLLDIMVPNEPTNSTKSTASLKRKKKRRKPKERIKTNHLTSNRIQFNSGLDWKEGYLLLIHDRESLSLTTRVFVKLHPSGVLSVEDRSIPSVNRNTMENAPELTSRTRYLDYFIPWSSTCQPWISEEVMSFHFCIDNILLLGSSALNHCATDGRGTNEKFNLLFAVDEGTGGALVDGFEWVSSVSRLIASSKSLYQSLYLDEENNEQ